MRNRFADGVGRGFWHDRARPFAAEMVDKLYERLQAMRSDKTLSPELRQYALQHMLLLRPIMGASFGGSTANDLLKLIFNATAIANLADNAAGSPLTIIDFALHTADPGSGGNMSTNEIAYAGYARASVARSNGALLVTGNSCSPVAIIPFPIGTFGVNSTATFFSCGYPGGGATKILFSGQITNPLGGLICGPGVTPRLLTTTTMSLN